MDFTFSCQSREAWKAVVIQVWIVGTFGKGTGCRFYTGSNENTMTKDPVHDNVLLGIAWDQKPLNLQFIGMLHRDTVLEPRLLAATKKPYAG